MEERWCRSCTGDKFVSKEELWASLASATLAACVAVCSVAKKKGKSVAESKEWRYWHHFILTGYFRHHEVSATLVRKWELKNHNIWWQNLTLAACRSVSGQFQRALWSLESKRTTNDDPRVLLSTVGSKFRKFY